VVDVKISQALVELVKNADVPHVPMESIPQPLPTP
jgi:hypothetical protein